MNEENASKILADIFAHSPAGATPQPVSDDDLLAWAEGTLTGAEFDRVQDHLDRCPESAELATRLTEALALRDEPLPFPVFVPSLEALRAKKDRQDTAALSQDNQPLALAAAEKTDLPEFVRIDELLPGFSGEATGDGCMPSSSSNFRLALTAPESPRPSNVAGSVMAVWPTGQTLPYPFEYSSGRWRAVITLPLPWPEVAPLLENKEIRLETVS